MNEKIKKNNRLDFIFSSVNTYFRNVNNLFPFLNF